MDFRVYETRYKRVNEPAIKLGCFSDVHVERGGDNKRFLTDLETAVNEGRRIHFNGDMMDLIHPGDPRYTASRLKDTHDAQLNLDTEFMAEMLRPYVDYIDRIGQGNHEGAPLKHRNYDFIRGLITLLNPHRSKSLAPIHQGAYRGLLRWNLQKETGGGGVIFKMMVHHLRGGAAPVTKGMIDIARLSDGWVCDVLWGGHKHVATMDAGRMIYDISSTGKMIKRTRKAMITPGYQSSVNDTTAEIDQFGDSAPYEETFYTGTPQGWGSIDVIPQHSDKCEPIVIDMRLRT